MLISISSVFGVGRTTILKRRLRAADMSLTPRSRVLAVAITENPFLGGKFGGQLRHRDPLLRQQGNHRVLHLRGAARDFLEPGQGAGLHRSKDRAFDQRRLAGPLRDEHRVVPRIADLFFRRAGCALHDLGGVAVDCRGKVLGQPALRRARLADEQAEPGL